MDFDFPSDENFWDYHGLAILENNQASFSYQKLVYFSGAYDSLLYDIDKDGENEIIVIDDTEDKISLSMLQFPLWLAFASEPNSQNSTDRFY